MNDDYEERERRERKEARQTLAAGLFFLGALISIIWVFRCLLVECDGNIAWAGVVLLVAAFCLNVRR